MKSAGHVHKLIGLVIIALACGVAWQFYASARSHKEAARTDAAFNQVIQRLDAYNRVTGHYPDSLAAITSTNTAEVQLLTDLPKIAYQRTQSGYVLSYTGFAGYRQSHEFRDEK